MENHQVLRRPHMLTEKANYFKERENKVVFQVDLGANKVEIRRAVEKLFNVKVLDVRTQIVRGKQKRVGRWSGQKSNWKKAVVTLREGDTIEFFEGV
jgi:large subunit ribosomal protein L23